MLDLNQRPPPCKRSTTDCPTFLELAKFLQISAFSDRRFSLAFPIFTWVAARLLHGLISFGGFEARLRPTEVEFLDGGSAPDGVLAKVVVVFEPVPRVQLVPQLEP
jgi:hypothetical protein